MKIVCLVFLGLVMNASQSHRRRGRDFRSDSLPVQLPGTGPWTPAVYLPLAQGRASAAGAWLPPAFQRGYGDLAKHPVSFK